MILALTSFYLISTHIHVIIIVTLVWCFFAFMFARDKSKTCNVLKNSNINWKEKTAIFFKSDFSISVVLFIIFLILIIRYYIF